MAQVIGWVQQVQSEIFQAIRSVNYGGSTSSHKTFSEAKLFVENAVGKRLRARKLEDKSPNEWELLDAELGGGPA